MQPAFASLIRAAMRFARSLGHFLAVLPSRMLLLPLAEWQEAYAERALLRAHFLTTGLCAVMTAYNGIISARTVAELWLSGIAVLALFAVGAMAALKATRGLYVMIPYALLLLNAIYCTPNIGIAILRPGDIDILSICFSVVHYAANNAFLKPLPAKILNGMVLFTVVVIGVVWLNRLPDHNPFETTGSLIINAVLFSTVSLVTQHLTVVFYRKSLTVLGETRAKIAALEAIQRHAAENRRVRDELARINRITVFEAMTTSISHEMNQPIGSALTFAEATRRWLDRAPPDSGEAMKALEGAISQIRRAGALISTIRAMTIRNPSDFRDVDAVALIRDLAELIRSDLVRLGVELELVGPVHTDALHIGVRGEEICQVILNLVNNAVEAFDQDQTDKRVTIAIGETSPGGWVQVCVEDNASGMSAETIARIFDSFFTTKPGGTGLGLPICREIAEGHGGSLQIDSLPGKGTCARLTIPSAAVPRSSPAAGGSAGVDPNQGREG